MTDLQNPRLRPLDIQPIYYQGQPMWFLRDPLQLSAEQLFFPQAMVPLLTLLDGRLSAEEVHSAFCLMVGEPLDRDITQNALARLDQALLLDNGRTAEAKAAQLSAYRAADYRPPALAGGGYPAEPQALADLLSSYNSGGPVGSWKGRGIVSPHIDYARGGNVYAKVWSQAEAAVLDAELIVILGTDHYGGLGTITLTGQRYATPFGVLPNDPDLVDALAEAWGADAAYADELHHRHEHSVELSAVWLHYIFHRAGSRPCPVVPILVGSFQHYLSNGHRPATSEQIAAFIDTLRTETEGRRTLVVASVDLAHVGPAFGDAFAFDGTRRAELARLDQALMTAATNGDAESWYEQIARVDDDNRICGFSPTYLLLRYLGPSSGRQIAYEQCPADHEAASFVSICSLLID